MPAWRTTKLDALAKALLDIQTKDELLRFLRDLCTLEELKEMSSRWDVVRRLDKKIPYRDIAQKTGLSTATISRIAHWLYHGEGGYHAALRGFKKRR